MINANPVTHPSWCQDCTGTPLMKTRACLDDSSLDKGNERGEQRGGLSAMEWKQLYERVLPNPFSMTDFQRVVLEGTLHNHFLAKDLHKFVMELRIILERHGELRMAAKLAVKGRKSELAHSAAAALKLLESERRYPYSEENHLAVRVVGGCLSPHLTACTTQERTGLAQGMVHSVPPRPASGLGYMSSFQPSIGCPTVSSTNSDLVVPENVFAGSSHSMVCETKNEILAMNNLSSPFNQVLHVVKRFQLRFGSIPLRFEIPVQYVEAVSSRRLRVQLTPFRQPATPARWPAAKDMVVYVNDQCVMTSWKRSWPERRSEVAKTFLLLDITQFLNRNNFSQKLHINVFSREYFSQLALMIVRPVPLDEVMEKVVKPLGDPPEERDRAMYALYQGTVENDEEDDDALGDDVEVDDPVITTKCPILQTRISIPIRGIGCKHLQCFDCQSFLLGCHKGCYWNCPLCDAELRPRDVMVDTVLWRYLQEVGSNCPLHLRLLSEPMVKEEVDEDKEVKRAKCGTVTRSFRWVPNRQADDIQNIVLDDDNNDNEAAMGRSDDDCRNHHNFYNNISVTTTLGTVHAMRSENIEDSKGKLPPDKQLGTAECPIEL